jgi:flagellar protein FliL
MTATLTPPDTAEPDAAPKKRRGRAVVVLVALVAAALGGGWFFLIKPGDTAPKPGEVAALDAIQVNLSDGHYLRLGIALQLSESAHEVDGSKALDAAIEVFSGHDVGEVNRPEHRDKLRTELEELLDQRYHDEVLGVYFTEFVTQ